MAGVGDGELVDGQVADRLGDVGEAVVQGSVADRGAQGGIVADAEREALLAPAHEQAHRKRLAALGCDDDEDLCAKIRDGSLDHRFGDVTEATRAAVVDKLTVANPAHLAIHP